MNKVTLILRILLGLILVVFGFNKFLNFLPPPELPESAGAFFGAIASANILTVIAIVEVISGLALLLNRYVALALILLAPISVNIILYHVSLDPAGIGPGAFVFLVNFFLLFANKDKYQAMLSAQ